MVDPACFDLAQSFLKDAAPLAPNDDALTMELAQRIQDAIEDWLHEAEEHLGKLA